jgi:hypothetical protein
LDKFTGKRASVVNYGVDGYGLDQEYLRYRKYEKHDIKHVVYVFCSNDLRNLYETDLVELTNDDQVLFKPPKQNLLYRVLGGLRITYLAISGFYKIKSMLQFGRRDWIQALEWRTTVKDQRKRFHDSYADSVRKDFLGEHPTTTTLQLARKFLLLTETWKREVESSGRTFTILVLPWSSDTAVATKLFRDFDGRVVFSNEYFGDYNGFRFRTDDHWNEYGNLRAAEFMADSDIFPFRREINVGLDTQSLRAQIDAYYRAERDHQEE